METPPPPDAPTPVEGIPVERRCPRCGSALATDQEWCLNCGAATGTEVVEARGWRVPLYLGGGLAALAVIGVILAILALASRNDVVAGNPTPTPSASAQAPPGATPSPLPTLTPLPSATATVSPDPNATATVSPDPNATASPEPTETSTPEPTVTAEPSTSSSFPGWTGSDGDYTIIIESASTQEGAEKVAQEAQDKGESPGILKSDDYSSLNGGYWVVFTGTYSTKSDAEAALDGVRSNFHDAYVRQIKT
ncbi:SPOR domain-containing protein [Solirubrobacter ginsenosidimutans]|uniref:SPOR domain-containing protein n=1 Tax=Solirubrobacter ginsenosidimutans TaxID=490573 RepID=A0A9X3S474_9ACTN|nr:SPOR domain-containing protein [Solirubrobacter ginsenosidimutans]MDA0165464.1 SPOR domain-containing protein [Solirubrobacter ginsenosidimutans]